VFRSRTSRSNRSRSAALIEICSIFLTGETRMFAPICESCASNGTLASLATVRELMRKALAWASIDQVSRLPQQMTQAQSSDARDKARTNRDAALKAIRTAWSHIFYPVKSDTAGRPFDQEHNLI
jgi:hypothetical protein